MLYICCSLVVVALFLFFYITCSYTADSSSNRETNREKNGRKINPPHKFSERAARGSSFQWNTKVSYRYALSKKLQNEVKGLFTILIATTNIESGSYTQAKHIQIFSSHHQQTYWLHTKYGQGTPKPVRQSSH